MSRLLFALLLTCLCSQAHGAFYQTAFFVEQNADDLTWRSLGFDESRLRESVAALTGESFSIRPPEWSDYIERTSFEDEDRNCLNDSSRWYLVAGRVVPFPVEVLNENPQLRLTFQPFCTKTNNQASDTALQIILESSSHQFNGELLAFTHKLQTSRPLTPLVRAGFTSAVVMQKFSDMPFVIGAKDRLQLKSQIVELKNFDFSETSIRWMASLPGQLDWVLGRLNKAPDETFEAAPILLKDQNGKEILNLGYFDFLPVYLRDPFQRLSSEKKLLLAPFLVSVDLHSNRETAKMVLETDLRISNPALTHHEQTSCIQCHSSQERIERAQSFLQHGGAKEFGYFFIGLGQIQDKPYVSWRSIQESRFNDQRIKHLFRERSQ